MQVCVTGDLLSWICPWMRRFRSCRVSLPVGVGGETGLAGIGWSCSPLAECLDRETSVMLCGQRMDSKPPKVCSIMSLIQSQIIYFINICKIRMLLDCILEVGSLVKLTYKKNYGQFFRLSKRILTSQSVIILHSVRIRSLFSSSF